jgi:taurine---2-oxoglutarate transaminase
MYAKEFLHSLRIIHNAKLTGLESSIEKIPTAEIIRNNLEYTLFPWSKQKGIDPIAVKHGGGVYLYDYEDKRYIDFSSGLMNVNIGHGRSRITEAVVRQMQEVSYVTPNCVTRVRGELGKELARLCPGNLNKAFLRYVALHQ